MFPRYYMHTDMFKLNPQPHASVLSATKGRNYYRHDNMSSDDIKVSFSAFFSSRVLLYEAQSIVRITLMMSRSDQLFSIAYVLTLRNGSHTSMWLDIWNY